jgi:Holliday junction DNA helicase RuvA
MFSYIRGKLVEKTPMAVVIDCGGIGYEIRIPISTYEKLGSLEKEARLLLHLAVSEDDMKLYGFHTPEERELFRLLISISGIGPKIGLSVLSALSVASFVKAIRTENDTALTIVPGLGKKTAQRLILELKDKLGSLTALSVVDSTVAGVDRLIAEAETALITLGYKQPDIGFALDELIKEEKDIKTSERLIKLAIQHLYKNRYPGKKRR